MGQIQIYTDLLFLFLKKVISATPQQARRACNSIRKCKT